MRNMNTVILSLLNGIAACILIALYMSLKSHTAFLPLLIAPSTLVTGSCAVIGSFIGYRIRQLRRSR